MRSRREPTSPTFVGALNLIEVEFHDSASVIQSWKDLLASLNDAWPTEGEALQRQVDKIDRLRMKMLNEIAKKLGIRVEQLDLYRGGYTPVLWARDQQQQMEVRELFRDLLNGNRALNVKMTD